MGRHDQPDVEQHDVGAAARRLLLHLPQRHDAESVAQAMIREMSQLPEHLRLSLTWDRGTELASYQTRLNAMTSGEGRYTIALSHHERWDGAGYPDGLAGEAIPIGARIVAIVDAYDAMTSDRPYRKALPIETVIRELQTPERWARCRLNCSARARAPSTSSGNWAARSG